MRRATKLPDFDESMYNLNDNADDNEIDQFFNIQNRANNLSGSEEE